MRTKTRTLALESLLAAGAVVIAGGCTHYWERPGGVIADFEQESAACIEDARKSPYGPDSMEPIYRTCMRGKGWKRVEVSVAEGDFLSAPPALGGKRYYQNR
jgi:ribosomal protein L14